jgi:hypothetical protein
LGFFYRNNRKAWMTSIIFNEWLTKFDALMRTRQRHVLLLLDNASSHISSTKLSNTTVLFLIPGTTSKFQPMDAGIIAAFKKHYRRFHWSHSLDSPRTNSDAYLVDVLSALRWCTAAWRQITPICISNCFRHSTIMESPLSLDDFPEMDENMDAFLIEQLNQLEIAQPVAVLAAINPKEENMDLHYDSEALFQPSVPVMEPPDAPCSEPISNKEMFDTIGKTIAILDVSKPSQLKIY